MCAARRATVPCCAPCRCYNENDRVHALVNAVKADQIDEIKRILIESGRSSWMYLQNVYAKNSPEQPLCVALSMAEYMLHDCGAYRVHGGGFAGTTLNLVPQRAGGALPPPHAADVWGQELLCALRPSRRALRSCS